MISLKRIGLVAAREFMVTVASKGFVIGVLAMPLVIAGFVVLIPKLTTQRGAQVEVEVALIDQGAGVAGSLRGELQPETLRARRAEVARTAAERVDPGAGAAVDAARQQAPESIPVFNVRELPASATVESEKAWLTEEGIGARARRALAVVPPAAIRREDGRYASYELYAPRNLPEDAENILKGALGQALIAERLRATGIDPQLVRDATRVAPPRTVVVSAAGQKEGMQGFNRALPFIMGILLFMFVMMGGQGLMTSTVEEKSSRVVEVLLAAVSPLELMWGKLIGHLGVSLVTMAVYIALGVLALLQFAMFGLFDPLLILYLVLFFLMAYLMFGALMQAIGAAVNQMADAQSLMGPVMLLLIVPYVLTPIIGRNPDSALALAASFIPPVNCFVMLARLASSTPPPVWQVLLSLLASLAGAIAAVWFAAKVFRIGLLMHGKPPSFATLVKWARMS